MTDDVKKEGIKGLFGSLINIKEGIQGITRIILLFLVVIFAIGTIFNGCSANYWKNKYFKTEIGVLEHQVEELRN